MISAARLAHDLRLDWDRTTQDLSDGFRKGHIRPEEFSWRDMSQHLITVHGQPLGTEGYRLMESRSDKLRFLENAGAVSSSAFRLVSQRIVDSIVLEAPRLPDVVLSQAMRTIPNGRKLIPEMPSPTIPLQEGKAINDVQEAEEYPILAVYGQRVRGQRSRKKGLQIPVTRELILEDDMGAFTSAMRTASQVVAREKEELICDYVSGAVPNAVIERRPGDTADVLSNLFLTAGRWINEQVAPLVDWNTLDTAHNLLLANNMPDTERGPVIAERTLLVTEQRATLGWRILNATETRSGTPNVVITGNPPAAQSTRLIASPHLARRHVAAGLAGIQTTDRWYYGDLNEAWRYYELWPIEAREDPQPADGITRDIWLRFVVSEMGIPVCIQPRVWARNLPA